MELYYHLWTGKRTFAEKNETSSTDETRKIVLLHGMGGTGALWRPIAANLEESWDVLAPDQRGHGESQSIGLPDNFSPIDYGTDILDTLSNLKFYPTWILGHSMGVRTALAAAHLRPDWFLGIILVDLGLRGAAGGGLGNTLEEFLKVLPHKFQTREEAKNFMAKNCPDPTIAQYLMAVSVKNPSGETSFPFRKQSLIKTIQAAAFSNVGQWAMDLAEKNMPLLFLRGQQSLVLSHGEFEAERKAFVRFPSVSFLEIPNAGHGLPFEKRSEFLEAIEQFTSSSCG